MLIHMRAVIDIILLAIIALCTWGGYKRGLIGGIAGLLAIVIALFGGVFRRGNPRAGAVRGRVY